MAPAEVAADRKDGPGRRIAGSGVTAGSKAFVPMPSACVSSLGITQTLFASPWAICFFAWETSIRVDATGATGVICAVRLTVTLAVWLSVTVMAREKLPVAVAFPEMTPLLPRVSPAGIPETDQV